MVTSTAEKAKTILSAATDGISVDDMFDAFTTPPPRVKQSPAKSYGASPIKRGRRTKADIERLKDEMVKLVEELRPMTVRQLFYQLVSKGLIAKSEQEYKGTVCRLLSELRRDGRIPYHWISDNTRWQRKPDTYSGLTQMLSDAQEFYRRAIWDDQDVYCEVWLEKDALAGVLWDVTAEWDVRLMVTRGYPSLSFVYSAAMAIQRENKPAFLYYFGDRDPSGVDIDRWVEQQIRELAPAVDLTFERVAVLPDQIDEYSLPTRPTKKSDSRSKGFEGESVEVDAIHPDTLRQLCRDSITQHIDYWTLQRTQAVEAAERDTLAAMIENMGGEE